MPHDRTCALLVHGGCHNLSNSATLQAEWTTSVCPSALAYWALLIHAHNSIMAHFGGALRDFTGEALRVSRPALLPQILPSASWPH